MLGYGDGAGFGNGDRNGDVASFGDGEGLYLGKGWPQSTVSALLGFFTVLFP